MRPGCGLTTLRGRGGVPCGIGLVLGPACADPGNFFPLIMDIFSPSVFGPKLDLGGGDACQPMGGLLWEVLNADRSYHSTTTGAAAATLPLVAPWRAAVPPVGALRPAAVSRGATSHVRHSPRSPFPTFATSQAAAPPRRECHQ